MKYKFSVIAPHQDDEYLGCRKFFEVYGNYIDNVVFVTNGEKSVSGLPYMLSYIYIRRKESENWIKSVCSNCDIHYLNLQDGLSLDNIMKGYGNEIFQSVNKATIFEFAQEKLYHIVGNNILLVPNSESHPTHKLTHALCETLPNLKIYYVVHAIFHNTLKSKPGVYYKKLIINQTKYFNYNYIYSDEELIQKRKDFQIYYNSQYEDFLKTGLNIRNWENYISEIPLKLISEDKTYKLGRKIKLEFSEGLL